MSKSRKFNFRRPSRPPPKVHSKTGEPVPLANKFQELVEQDELPSVHHKPPAPGRSVSTTTMSQRLQDLLGESEDDDRRSPSCAKEDQKVQRIQHDGASAGGDASRGAEHLRNDELEALDNDNSDDGGWVRSSVKVVPMAQRLQELLGEDKTHRQKQKAKGPATSDPGLRYLRTDDDIETSDNVFSQVPLEPPVIKKAHPLPSMAEQFQEALKAAPSSDSLCLPSIQILKDHDSSYSNRLQRVLQLEKQAQAMKGLPSHGPFDSIQVQVLKKSLEGRLTTCKCQVVQAPLNWMGASSVSSSVETVEVIFNAKVAAELELDVGGMVRINPPWQELTTLGSLAKVILCTYFCEAVY